MNLTQSCGFISTNKIEENLTNGISLDEARLAASRSLGSVTRVKEQCHDSLGLTLIDSLSEGAGGDGTAAHSERRHSAR